ncbi:MAG: glycosyltransferase family 39 protein [Candidatus Levybacteria bacterium]|nr:glycosyltransferase family 39 protein [Candidatus Levybacteria bacterium]
MKSKTKVIDVGLVKKFIIREKILLAILFVASILRFLNYSNRWALAYDQAWFAVIARHALETLQLPLLGPFASGGPFQTGGEWFWIVMVGVLINPFSVISPWIFITLLSILQVYLLFFLGKQFISRNFGYVVAILGAVSTSQTLQATNLTNQMTASIFATLFLIFFLQHIKTRKKIYLLLLGLSVGLSSSIHLQGILLLPALLIAVIFAKIIKPREILLIGFGLLLPWIPVLISDSNNNFYNTLNMFNYAFMSQGQVSYEMLGRRWLTFVGIFIPSSWGRIIGGFPVFGYAEIVLVALISVKLLLAKSIKREWWIILLSLVAMIICLRYIRTPIYENYITFLHPFIFLITGLMIWEFFKIKRLIGILVLSGIVFSSIIATMIDIRGSSNVTAIKAAQYRDILKSKFPGSKFALYDYKYKSGHRSLPLVYFLQTERLLDNNGQKIGAVQAALGEQILFVGHKALFGKLGDFQLYDLSASSSSVLEKHGWSPVNPSFIYNSVQYWYKK